jgi:hypothetical protein
MLHDIDKEFEALYSRVVEEIRYCLQDADPRIRLDACEKWLKAHGKFQPNQKTQVNITAEDVVVQILNQYSQP